MTHISLRTLPLIALVLSLFVTGFPATAQEQPVTITLWHIATEGDPFRPVLQGAIDRFNAAQSDVRFEATAIPNEQLGDQLRAAIAENRQPDVFQTWGGGQLKMLVDAGIARPIAALSGEAARWFVPNALAPSTFNGQRYAVPANLAGVFLWANLDLFAQHNVLPPATWSAFLDACRAFRQAGVTPVALGNRDRWTGAFWFDYLALRLGGAPVLADAVDPANPAPFTNPAFGEAGRRLQEAVSAGCFQDGFNSADYGSAQQLLASGQAAMQLQGDWNLGGLKQVNAELVANSIGVLPFPAVEGGQGGAGDLLGGTGQAFAVSVSAPPETEAALLDMLASHEFGLSVAQAGFLPAVAGYEAQMTDPVSQTMATMLAEASAVQLYLDQSLAPSLAQLHLDNTFALFENSTTPEQAAQTLARAAAYTPLAAQDDSPLRVLAEAQGIAVGAAVSVTPLRHDSRYAETLAREFNLITPETEMKMGPLRPSRDSYDFDDADAIVAFAETNGMQVRGHALVWHNQQPGWLEQGNFSREELMEILRDHIYTVVGRYQGRVAAWDVVNEAIADDGSMRDNLWLRGIGPEYIDLAFQWAREADPNALLFYNDYDAEGLGAKSDAVYQLVAGLVGRGVPIDGVGMQMHVSIGEPPRVDDVRANMERLAALGLQVQITEMDVQIQDGSGSEPERFAAQAQVYGDIARLCLQVDACTAFVLWGFTDQYTWIPGYTGNPDAPLPFDAQYRPKPAYEALQRALAGG